MLPIAIQNGRHSSLPPLLLPDVFRPTPSYDPFLQTKRHFSSLSAGVDAPALSVPPVALGPTPHTLVAADAGVGVTSLESLASLATKRRKLQLVGSRGAISHALAPASAAAAAETAETAVSAVTPPAMHPDRAATTQGAAAHGAPARETPAVPSPPSSVGSITPHEKRIVPASAPVAPMAPLSDNKSAAHAVGDMRSKRQRIGPSCDSCRLKKIKCDASIEILYQDECIVALGSDSLHVQLTREDCAQLPCKVREALPRGVLEHVTGQARDPDLALVKHVDKLVAFRPCSSCTKRCSGSGSAGGAGGPTTATATAAAAAAAAVECQFSKGLTRADINVFTRLERQLGPRDKLASFTVGDYRLVGY